MIICKVNHLFSYSWELKILEIEVLGDVIDDIYDGNKSSYDENDNLIYFKKS